MHNPHVWGWEIPLYLFLGGMTAGLMIVSAVAPKRESRAMRLLPFIAILMISIGMLALFLDLDSKLHVWRFYTALRLTSPMSWGAWILLAIYPAAFLYGIALSDIPAVPAAVADFARRNFDALRRWNLALGVALGAYTGILLAALGARALWSSLLLAPLFLVSGFTAAVALAMLLPVTHEERETLRRWDVYAIVTEIVLLGMLFADLAAGGGERGRAAAALFFGGAYTAQFWTFVVVAGLLVPLILELAEKKWSLRAAPIAPVLLLTGGLALRWILVAAGQVS